MNKIWLWKVRTVIIIGFLCSCSIQEIISDTVEFEANEGLQTQKPKSSHPNAKQQAKEKERMKQEGKCPSCRGAGKTPDGRYTCTMCKGSGKYQ